MRLPELLRRRAADTPAGTALVFLPDGDVAHAQSWSWRDWDQAADGWARGLSDAGLGPEDRVLLADTEGLEFAGALLGTLRQGAVAVPVPVAGRQAEVRIASVRGDCSPVAVLGADVHGLPRIHPVSGGQAAGSGALAYLQYTSGSTSTPRGVVILHDTLMHQLADFDAGYGHEGGCIVSWLPATHDLGLVYGRLMGLFAGIPTVFMAPARFVERPRRWLEALTHFGGTHSASPDFGYAYAAERVTDTDGLDLRAVRVLLNGAEPIRRDSERVFVARFRPVGLAPTALTHAMGMSEATAKIVTEAPGEPPTFVTLDRSALARGRAVDAADDAVDGAVFAGCGRTSGDTTVTIVDPTTHTLLPDDHIGELWVTGTTVAGRYWNAPEASAHTFEAVPVGRSTPHLRTGDLGFTRQGVLFLVDRLRDLVIVRGLNVHPPDIEAAIIASHPAIRPNRAAAFQWEDGLGIAVEIDGAAGADVDDVFTAVRRTLGELGCPPLVLVALHPRTLPLTSSGKIRRAAAAAAIRENRLGFARWTPPENGTEPTPDPLTALIRAVAAQLAIPPDLVETDRPLRDLGLDSVTAVDLVERVSRSLGRPLPGTALFDHPTLAGLARQMAPERPTDPVDPVDAMTEEEALAALLAELENP